MIWKIQEQNLEITLPAVAPGCSERRCSVAFSPAPVARGNLMRRAGSRRRPQLVREPPNIFFRILRLPRNWKGQELFCTLANVGTSQVCVRMDAKRAASLSWRQQRTIPRKQARTKAGLREACCFPGRRESTLGGTQGGMGRQQEVSLQGAQMSKDNFLMVKDVGGGFKWARLSFVGAQKYSDFRGFPTASCHFSRRD